MFHYLLDPACLNAYIIFQRKGERYEDWIFRHTNADQLLHRVKHQNPYLLYKHQSPKPTWLLGCHFPHFVLEISKKPIRRCVLCWSKAVRKDSYWCLQWLKTLCVASYFRISHVYQICK
jgi:hypothetical protein